MHAASVGEVLAARVLVHELISRKQKFELFLSTMTKQGRAVARAQLPKDVICFLAPLDVPVNVRGLLKTIAPDIYVCLETELWPAMFIELKSAGIPAVALNGRMTKGSLRRYLAVRQLMARILGSLSGLAVISREHGDRFLALGARPESLLVSGNIKYDYPVEDVDKMRDEYRKQLGAEDRIVFVCGSTRTGEEDILVNVYRVLLQRSGKEVLWVVAPRHLERLEKVKRILAGAGFAFDLYSELKSNGRNNSVVLVDTMGDLERLYSAGDFNFVGGSLADRGGHNIMEAARWGRPVYYGPGMHDFSDAAEVLEKEGGSFRVADGDELAAVLIGHLENRKVYEQACVNASRAVSLQKGAAARQADMVVALLADIKSRVSQ